MILYLRAIIIKGGFTYTPRKYLYKKRLTTKANNNNKSYT